MLIFDKGALVSSESVALSKARKAKERWDNIGMCAIPVLGGATLIFVLAAAFNFVVPLGGMLLGGDTPVETWGDMALVGPQLLTAFSIALGGFLTLIGISIPAVRADTRISRLTE